MLRYALYAPLHKRRSTQALGGKVGSSPTDCGPVSRGPHACVVFSECGPRPESPTGVSLVRRNWSLCAVRCNSSQARHPSPPKAKRRVFPFVVYQRNRMASLVSDLVRRTLVRPSILGSADCSGFTCLSSLGPQGTVGQRLVALRSSSVPPYPCFGAFASLFGIWMRCIS